ncbi:MAG: glycosyltransferase family 2 protein, partial [Alistipes sp.]|nr:glycosyltransferase family 2 protein [Alistipes sp.]
VLIPSSTILRRDLVLRLGGFPEGMRMGEDQYLWTKVARATKIAYSPKELVLYSRAASNRSAASFRGERTRFSLEELYDERESEMSNEYVARVALGKALLQSAGGDTEAARRALEFFAYNRLSKRIERKVRALNALPRFMRAAVLATYNTLAWIVARKGL